MELRKTAMLKAPCRDFYEAQKTANNIEDIKKLRIAYLAPVADSRFIGGYRDEDWQLYFMMYWSAPNKDVKEYIFFDFDTWGILKDTPKDYEPKNYMREMLRIYTDYDVWGRPRKEPIDADEILRRGGYL